MDTKNIIIGVLALAVVGLGLKSFGVFGGSSDSLRDQAKDRLTASTTPAANNTATPATPAAPVGPTTKMTFSESEFDFGTVDEGEKVEHIYKFTNDGDEPLTISNAKGSCGCTVPEWPKEPIAPGESGEILVSFDTKNKPNKQTKTVTITANTEPAQTFLKITGFVNGKAGAAAPAAPAAQ